jgi:beta-1,4-N-acetylglucosaminyltransferase
MGRRVLVTVGTTRFDDLIRSLEKAEVLEVLRSVWTCQTLVVQHGSGRAPAAECIERYGIKLEVFAYTNSMADEQAQADLIISHAGAGSILEALERCKPLVVVINETLMDNHQWELALALAERAMLSATTCERLAEALRDAWKLDRQPLPAPARGIIAKMLLEER